MFICNQTCLKLKNLCIELYIYNIHSIYNFIDVIGIYGEGMAIHSSILAWKVPWAEEPGGLLSVGSQEWDTT